MRKGESDRQWRWRSKQKKALDPYCTSETPRKFENPHMLRSQIKRFDFGCFGVEPKP
jgi:hypothetical protein